MLISSGQISILSKFKNNLYSSSLGYSTIILLGYFFIGLGTSAVVPVVYGTLAKIGRYNVMLAALLNRYDKKLRLYTNATCTRVFFCRT
ncbi:hypothetical protein GCM10022218_29400 [Sphingobacterium ginsenosidimutans]|uniref:Major facilitator superfamily (MFS) profile domain-containing protein n=1 Tax=Sphingobacterium ginsenosidimutans TaxID=687845 RepID=A0ABP8A652_9SPHI